MRKYTRRSFLSAAAKGGALGLTAAALPGLLRAEDGDAGAEADRDRPNIVFVFGDQLRAQALGCYGNDFVPTPNLDAMAAGGTVFDHALSPWPVCSPYRAMLMTGRYPMVNGTVINDVGMRGDLPTIARVLRDGGYRTGYIGKWHLEWTRRPFVPPDRRMGFYYWAGHNVSHRQYLGGFYCSGSGEHVPFTGYEPEVQTNLAIDYIRSNAGHPFCLFLSWGPPHDPYNTVPQAYKDRIDPTKIKLRPNTSERAILDDLLAHDQPDEGTAARRKNGRAVYDFDERVIEECLHGYYAHTIALDDCMGRIRKALRDSGQADNTILVFTSDHGDMLGAHRMASKQSPLEESLRIPLLIERPGTIPAGRRCDSLIGPMDLMPTLLKLAGLDCPQVDGRSQAAALMGQAAGPHDAMLIMKMLPGGIPYAFNATPPWRGVRTQRYTYAWIVDRGPWLLFDNQRDPGQLDNLIDRPEYADLQAKLHARMRELMADAGDPGDTAAVEAFRESRRPKDI